MIEAMTLTLLGWAVCYPSIFISRGVVPFPRRFIKSQIYFMNLISGVALLMVLMTNIDWPYKLTVVIWKAVLIIFSRWQWWEKPITKITILATVLMGIGAVWGILLEWTVGSFWFAISLFIIQGMLLSQGALALSLGYRMLKGQENDQALLNEGLNKFTKILLLRVCFGLAIIVLSLFHLKSTNSYLVKGLVLPQTFWLLTVAVNGMIFPFVTLIFLRDSIRARAAESTSVFILGMFICALLADLQVKYLMMKYHIIL